MEVTKDPNSNPQQLNDSDSELELYTIPISSRWFLWDEIHETERTALKEFFDGTSISRNPKIYKEYRDFIINKYREEPSRRLVFTDVRKSLVGDVTLLAKVFRFLENWGLINYGAGGAAVEEEDEEVAAEEKGKVRAEEGAPNGIRVSATPNSLKPISVPRAAKTGKDVGGGGGGGAGVKLPLLVSYSDVYGDLMKQKELNCGLCRDRCDSGHYRSNKDNFIICAKCFKNGNYGENRSVEDFISNESSENSGKHEAAWTEGETLLLLESVLKHGDEWELVAQSVKTKSKLDCISKLIELPFGDLILGSAHRNGNGNIANGTINNAKQVQSSSSDHQETSKTQDQGPEITCENEQNGDAVKESPSKRQRVAALSDSSSSLMKQVGHISTVVDPHITAAAADAAVNALCNENMCPREIFDDEEGYAPTVNSLLSNSARALEGEGLEMEKSTESEVDDRCPKDGVPLTLRIRAAIATALGAAAARAKLLADQEDREIEHLVATIIEAQIGKLEHKVKHFDDLELLMEKEHTETEALKDSIFTERVDMLKRTFRSGVTRWKDYSYVKS